jgi:hypothetical protein
MQSLPELYFFTMRIYTSAKQYSSRSGSNALFFTRIFACGKPRQNEAPL